jgi:homogentisate 1,2-dioxygenase
MSGHGPDAETFHRASQADTTKPHKIDNTLAFMFETPRIIKPTAYALETSQLQANYFECWQGLRKNFSKD